jgi:D-alanyl-D-alanine carboxypeptidase/D-alanyl-D-alanine-endopeptidase (penicillin-binding protein 4)
MIPFPPVRTAAARLSLVAAVLLPAGCASAGAVRPGLLAPEPLAAIIDSVVSSEPLDRTQWGIAVRDARSGEWLVRLNAARHFVPASNTKLVVTTVAMGELGPDYRFETPVFVHASPGDSVAAELVIIGRGDPTFSERFHASDFAVSDSIAETVAAHGIRRIGDIIVDATFFGDRMINGTWEVGDLPAAYAPPIDAFAIGEATVQLVIAGGTRAGEPGRAETIGPAGLQHLRASVVTDTAGARGSARVDFLARSHGVVLDASVGAGSSDTTRIAVTDPAAFAARAVEAALRARGIRVDGTVRVVRDSVDAARLRERLHADFRRIAAPASPPLTEIVAAILRPSQNWIAEMLLKTLGAERRGSGGWNTGLDVERRYLIDVARVDSTSFSLRDASGLSPQNLLAPEAIVALLQHARTSPWAQAYHDALPEPGMEDGTLESRLLELRGRLRAKTGSITNVNTLSGYLTTADGRELIFSIMTNASGAPAAAVRRGMDRIVQAVATGRER